MTDTKFVQNRNLAPYSFYLLLPYSFFFAISHPFICNMDNTGSYQGNFSTSIQNALEWFFVSFDSDLESLSILWFYPILTLPRGSKDSTRWSHKVAPFQTLIIRSLQTNRASARSASNKFKTSQSSPRLDNSPGWVTEFCVTRSLFHDRGCRLLTG